ncbi:MAG TPA: tetratricopeptide repeat protein [Rhizomicrobium sp.]|nr:tetratricopeptide repeat protein [Rhizomicrobium sp.]
MLGCAVPAQAGWFSSDPKPAKEAPKAQAAATPAPAAPTPAATLEDSLREAQMLRLAGQYPEAVKHLSQMMMVAADDGRVIGEYGKTLAAMGRASDAVNFLTRAQQLLPGDWTIYSALGVAYDQTGDQRSAQAAYETALKIKPEEPSVLNNYALSRMLAKDPENARRLAARAETAGGMSDDKIARNISMIRSMAPEAALASNPAPVAPVAANTVPHPQASAAPIAAAKPDNKVVMQRVPVDPLAGPVQKTAAPAKPAQPASVATAAPASNPAPVKAAEVKAPAPVTAATGAPRPLLPATAAPSTVAQAPQTKPVAPTVSMAPLPAPVKAAEAAKPAPAAAAAATPVKPVDSKPAFVAKAATPEAKPDAVKAAEAVKPAPAKAPVASAPVKVATPVSTPAKTAEADKTAPSVSLTMAPVKAADAGKPAAAPKVLPAKAEVKTAETAPKSKDAIPGLRMSANAY